MVLIRTDKTSGTKQKLVEGTEAFRSALDRIAQHQRLPVDEALRRLRDERQELDTLGAVYTVAH